MTESDPFMMIMRSCLEVDEMCVRLLYIDWIASFTF